MNNVSLKLLKSPFKIYLIWNSVIVIFSIPQCLTPLYSVDGWQVTTVEGIGSQKKGFHPIQERIAKFNGSQCGYCTPGMVMNMYGWVQIKKYLNSPLICHFLISYWFEGTNLYIIKCWIRTVIFLFLSFMLYESMGICMNFWDEHDY